jgi:type IV pilus assembly protein PilY1
MKWKSLLTVAALTVAAGLSPVPRISAAPGVDDGGVDLAGVPLVSGLTKSVPPNIYFILDDSTSMNWEFMPDAAWGAAESNCFKNHGFNTVYFDPSVTYLPPKRADGTSYPDSNYLAALNDGFDATKGATDLSSDFRPYELGDNRNLAWPLLWPGAEDDPPQMPPPDWVAGPAAAEPEPAYYFRHNASPDSPPSTCEAEASYTKVLLSDGTPAERQNFANWYSYYRTRMLAMKSAAGRAFATLDQDTTLRVGFVTINESDPQVGSPRFLKLARFAGQHRADWYEKLYGAGCPTVLADGMGGCGTPLRGALSRAGQLYAGQVLAGDNDPVQYSCQRNYSILTTDGYWNTLFETPQYGPKKIDNVTDVGDQDGVAGTPRPFFDASAAINSLADIALYYYATDLRPAGSTGGLLDDGVTTLDVSEDNVPPSGDDTAAWQHMATFALGLGVSGVLAYSDDYLNGGSADYNEIVAGTKEWPNPHSNPLDPDYGKTTVIERVDDLWHAAVNGRGQYLNAGSPDALVSALTRTLATISISSAAAAAASTSNLEPVAGDNAAYVGKYTTGHWDGDLVAREIDLETGELSEDATWSAADQLQEDVDHDADSRRIYTFDDGRARNLKAFTTANLAEEIAAGYFRSDAANPGGALSQFALWDAAQAAVADADAMIGFLRGQTGNEDEIGNPVRLFRDRVSPLGDIVNASPVYVGRPAFRYGDAGYTAFTNEVADRPDMVYVGANDGMLHAFDAETGTERWAFIPSVLVPNLYKLADAGYASKHRFFVDGTITVGDAYDANSDSWRTVLVGGLGGGGRAYFAIDVTDPDNPRALWEFDTDDDVNLGYTYGNPLITKTVDGRWVVVFASGYDNLAPGDEQGRLYVVDAFTGEKLDEIVADANSFDANETGIAKVSNFVANTLVDNVTQYVYGGDLAGNLWRFDLAAGVAQRLGRTAANAGDQPITVRPELGRVKDSLGVYQRVVYFGTGRYLGESDLDEDAPSNTVAQAIYAVKDTGQDLGVLTGQDANLVRQVLDVADAPRRIPNPVPVDWSDGNGWYVETPVGERITVDPRLQLGSLVVLSNSPEDDECTIGGSSWLYTLDFRTGGAIVTQRDMAVGQRVGGAIGTGLSLIRLPNKKLIAVVAMGDASVRAMNVPVGPSAGREVRRVGWRELY